MQSFQGFQDISDSFAVCILSNIFQKALKCSNVRNGVENFRNIWQLRLKCTDAEPVENLNNRLPDPALTSRYRIPDPNPAPAQTQKKPKPQWENLKNENGLKFFHSLILSS